VGRGVVARPATAAGWEGGGGGEAGGRSGGGGDDDGGGHCHGDGDGDGSAALESAGAGCGGALLELMRGGVLAGLRAGQSVGQASMTGAADSDNFSESDPPEWEAGPVALAAAAAI
jgi:hypothetical protein